MEIIINSFGDNPVCVVQDCDTAKEAWDKLKSHYVGQTMINKISIFNTLLNTKICAGGDKGNHTSIME